MHFHPTDNERNLHILERMLFEAERMLPEEDHGELLRLISHGSPDEVFLFIKDRLPVSDLVARVRAA